MKHRLTGMMVLASLAMAFASCGGTANENANTNANRVANANTAMAPANTNTNANTNTRKALTRAEYERDKARYTKEAKDAGRTVGAGLNDGWLWVKTRYELAAADDLRDSTINVDVNNDVVTLNGTVATAAQKAKAEAVAKAVEGVKSVKNLLKVTAPANANANANHANRNK
jgi:hyperosmotically inducible protein